MSVQPKLKVCGVNDAAFAAAAEARGVDYLGFIFAEGSPRRVTPDEAAAITARLSGAARRVGVFVRETPDEIVRVMRHAGLDVVQLHRRASETDVAALHAAGYEVWTLAGGAPGDAVLFDSSHGDGETALRRGPWRTVLAGGISAENVAAALSLRPDVIDVSGSLETSPGRKDVSLLDEFVRAFRNIAMRLVSDGAE
ncbi:MAG: phosphoribosylanthranilate isomerase [Kiritimatiellae bacterium]|nr:phosphoribosylanthranilate isomerase [Kiritimatiellia bacterium]